MEVEKNKIQNDCDLSNNYSNKIKDLKAKINKKDIEIKKVNEELNLSLSVYQEQIDKLEEENIKLDKKYKNNDFKYKIENINQQIDFLFKGIKSKINEIDDTSQKDKLIKDMIQDINNCLDSKNDINYTLIIIVIHIIKIIL